MQTRASRLAALGAVALGVSLSAVGSVSGTIAYAAKAKPITITPKFVAYVTGPDDFDPKKTVRRLIFSTVDLAKEIQACTTLDCSDDKLMEGFEVDIVDGPRLNTWFVGNGQLVQNSDSAELASLKKTTDTADHLAGSIAIDKSGSGGVKASLTFDATRVKAFTKAR